MVELIVGKKGKGKTKVLLDRVNNAVKEANGSIVYLDKSTKHMYELNNKVRLIDVSSYPLKNADEFVGFICGIISQDHDLEQIYLDSFLKVSKLEDVKEIVELMPDSSVCRELILIKVRATAMERTSLNTIANIFRANVVDVSAEHMMIELTGTISKIDAFIKLLDGFEIDELFRTGITGLTRGFVR